MAGRGAFTSSLISSLDLGGLSGSPLPLPLPLPLWLQSSGPLLSLSTLPQPAALPSEPREPSTGEHTHTQTHTHTNTQAHKHTHTNTVISKMTWQDNSYKSYTPCCRIISHNITPWAFKIRFFSQAYFSRVTTQHYLQQHIFKLPKGDAAAALQFPRYRYIYVY